jgi:hypothetical protein
MLSFLDGYQSNNVNEWLSISNDRSPGIMAAFLCRVTLISTRDGVQLLMINRADKGANLMSS